MGILTWLGKREIKRIDDLSSAKADKDSVDEKHEENKKEFAEIKKLLQDNNEVARVERARLGERFGELVTQVAVLTDRVGPRKREST